MRDDSEVYKAVVDDGDSVSVVLIRPTNADADEGVVPSPQAVEMIQRIEPTTANLAQLTDDGLPSVMIERHHANDTYEYTLYRLGNRLDNLLSFENGRYQLRVEKSGDKAAIITSDRFEDWGARAPSPQIVLKWRNGRLALDPLAMRKPAPKDEDLAELRRVIKQEFKKYPRGVDVNSAPPELADEVFQLYYTGHGKTARTFFDSCWPKKRAGKRAYWAFLMREAKKSKYWHSIAAINGVNLAGVPQRSR